MTSTAQTNSKEEKTLKKTLGLLTCPVRMKTPAIMQALSTTGPHLTDLIKKKVQRIIEIPHLNNIM